MQNSSGKFAVQADGCVRNEDIGVTAEGGFVKGGSAWRMQNPALF